MPWCGEAEYTFVEKGYSTAPSPRKTRVEGRAAEPAIDTGPAGPMFNLRQMRQQTPPLECRASRDEGVAAFRPLAPEPAGIAGEQESAAITRGTWGPPPGRLCLPKDEESEK
jgi:hypothetical protein